MLAMVNKFNQLKIENKSANNIPKNYRREKYKALHGCWKQQWRYAWLSTLTDMGRQPFTTLLIMAVIAVSLTLPNLCYLLMKSISQIEKQLIPKPQLTVYLDKALSDDASIKIIDTLKQEIGIAKIIYLSREETISEFRNWSGFTEAVDMLEENPLPAVAIIIPEINLQNADYLKIMRDHVAAIKGVDEVRVNDSLFVHLAKLVEFAGRISIIIGIMMIIAVFLIISNSISFNISNRRDTIHVMKLIGATDRFILRPFLNNGILLGLGGALLSLILSSLLIWQLKSMVISVTSASGATFVLHGFNWDETILLMFISSVIGWLSAWLVTVQHLNKFAPN